MSSRDTVRNRHLSANESVTASRAVANVLDSETSVTNNVSLRPSTPTSPGVGRGRLSLSSDPIFTNGDGANFVIGSSGIVAGGVSDVTTLNFPVASDSGGGVVLVDAPVISVEAAGTLVSNASTLNFVGTGPIVTDSGGGEIAIGVSGNTAGLTVYSAFPYGATLLLDTETQAYFTPTSYAPQTFFATDSNLTTGNSTAIGHKIVDGGGSRYSFCIGSTIDAGVIDLVAIGHSISMDGSSYSVMIGDDITHATVGTTNSHVVIGSDVVVGLGDESVVIGSSATGIGSNNVAVGAGVEAKNETFSVNTTDSAENTFDTAFSVTTTSPPSAGSLTIPDASRFFRVTIGGTQYDIPLLNSDAT